MSELLEFLYHKDNCEYLQPMWHKGPCDCGLYDLMDKLPGEVLQEIRQSLVDDWKDNRTRRAARL